MTFSEIQGLTNQGPAALETQACSVLSPSHPLGAATLLRKFWCPHPHLLPQSNLGLAEQISALALGMLGAVLIQREAQSFQWPGNSALPCPMGSQDLEAQVAPCAGGEEVRDGTGSEPEGQNLRETSEGQWAMGLDKQQRPQVG